LQVIFREGNDALKRVEKPLLVNSREVVERLKLSESQIHQIALIWLEKTPRASAEDRELICNKLRRFINAAWDKTGPTYVSSKSLAKLINKIGRGLEILDIAAGIGLAGIRTIDQTLRIRNELFKSYESGIKTSDLKVVGKSETEKYYNSAWLITVIVGGDRVGLMRKLRENGVESAQVHYRNDRYSIFGGRRDDLPIMDELEDRYLVLPLHTKMGPEHVARICAILNSGW
jgi:dTDP-4-amino-4,6-dideoxygalactose transaminase